MSATITMSNYIFSSQIDLHSKIVYAGLKKYSNSEGLCFPSRNTLAEICKISLSTLRKAINNLVEAKIVNKESRFRQNGSQTSNLYSLTPFMTSGDYYFKIRSDIFDLHLSEQEIIVYMYLCSCSNKDYECFPSIKQIANACSISQTSVKVAIKELIKRDLIIKDNQYRIDGGKRNNLYKIVTEEDNNIVNENEIIDQKEYIMEKDQNSDNLYKTKINKEIFNQDKVINKGEIKENDKCKQSKYIFNTDIPGEKIKVNIRDDIFDFKLSKHSALVYLYICTYSELKVRNMPSYEKIAEVCKISMAKVANAILELKTSGLIDKIKQEKTNNTMVNIEPPPWTIQNTLHSRQKITHN
ncbi:helix-turn-helix domain-containing protein [Sedimentibacter sp. MB31-C6]|uniref:helix-turn-helix domain-containing protein n=1 Tax=Sedimentibacter sp. MB31-C6 TaxID=3109366 RepID=UPI002DDD1F18|nr:helix-turn-helix domain-containing protein [Sedimentibacter sp. MB36-C1]WSI05109.1 helix-turn-helix domain-containing protein [Sedimentibacter sp. MB36-C1]